MLNYINAFIEQLVENYIQNKNIHISKLVVRTNKKVTRCHYHQVTNKLVQNLKLRGTNWLFVPTKVAKFITIIAKSYSRNSVEYVSSIFKFLFENI